MFLDGMRQHQMLAEELEESLILVLQALLARHEQYVAGAENERSRMRDAISRFERTNKELESTNTRLRDENRRLEDHIDDINVAAMESESQIKTLETSLNSTQHELKRWKHRGTLTESLEEQLLQLETEQSNVQSELVISKEDQRMAQQRWHATQYTVRELEAQIESIERDAEMERQRHQEHVERIERQATVQRHMEQKRTNTDHKNEIISIFVQDLLQDNTNLQIRAAELEEALKRSDKDESPRDGRRSPIIESIKEPAKLTHRRSLSDELRDVAKNESPQEFQTHHQHLVTSVAARSRTSKHARASLTRRSKMILPVTHAGIPPPRQYSNRSNTESSSVSNAESERHVQRYSHRSVPSQSSALSSGRSCTSYAPSTIFEHDSAHEEAFSSRPTSSDTNFVLSPMSKPTHSARHSNDFGFFRLLSPAGSVLDHQVGALHRSPSRESMRSISGMDIHSTLPESNKAPVLRMPLRSKPSLAQMGGGHNHLIASAKLGGQHAPVSEMLRKKLGEYGKRAGEERYAPIRDTLGQRVGGWFGAR